MIDVYEQVKPLLTFDSEDDFYFLQLLRRRKDNPEIIKNNNVVKNYFIRSTEYLERKMEEIKKLCDIFNARAALRLNKRSYKKVTLRTMQNIVAQLMQEDYSSTRSAYVHACGQCHNDKDKTWIIDIDDFTPDQVSLQNDLLVEMKEFIYWCRPEGDKIVTTLPTKNGIHLITRPFDMGKFGKEYPKINIHKDNPINLYIP